MDIQLVTSSIASFAPIDGVSIGNPADKSTWRIDFRRGASDAQKAAAQAWLAAYDPLQDDLRQYAQAKRAAAINSGCIISVNGSKIPIWTDANATAAINGALAAAQVLGSAFATAWKGSDGNFYLIDNAGIFALALGAFTYVTQCFAAEAGIRADIAAGKIASQDQIDAAAWPSSTTPIVVPAVPQAATADNLVGAVASLQTTVDAIVKTMHDLGKTAP